MTMHLTGKVEICSCMNSLQSKRIGELASAHLALLFSILTFGTGKGYEG